MSQPMPLAAESGRTRAVCITALAVLVVGGIAAHWVYLTRLCPFDLTGDEAHYWDWSRQLDTGYYSKGPAVAWIIRGSCSLLGETMAAVRVPAAIFAAGIVICAYWLTRRLFGSHRLALAAVLIMHVVPLFIAGSLLMTIDPPMMFAWALATCWLASVMGLGGRGGGQYAVCSRQYAVGKRQYAVGSGRDAMGGEETSPNPQSAIRNPQFEIRNSKALAWLLIGLAIGLGALAKYGTLLWLPIMLLTLAADERSRRWLRTIWPWLASAIALACLAPVYQWNARHGWVSFYHVSQQTGASHAAFEPRNVMEFVGGQIGVLGPAMFIIVVAAIVDAIRRGGREQRFLVLLGVPFLVIVLATSFRAKAQANWAAPAYFSLVILGSAYVVRRLQQGPARALWQTMLWLAAVTGLALYVMLSPEFLYPQAVKLLSISGEKLPTRKLTGCAELGRRIGQMRMQDPECLILAQDYQTASQIAFYTPGRPKTFCAGAYFTDLEDRKRQTQFDIWPDRLLNQPSLRGRDAIYVGHLTPAMRHDLETAFASVAAEPELLGVWRNGVKIRTFRIWRCRNFRGMTLPCDHVSH